MATETTPVALIGRRAGALADMLSELERNVDGEDSIDDGWFAGVTLLLVDGILTGDYRCVNEAVDGLSVTAARQAGWLGPARVAKLQALYGVAAAAQARLSTKEFADSLDPASHAGRMIAAISGRPGLDNTELGRTLGIGETEVSRTGARLKLDGYAVARRIGRRNRWELTPRGTELAGELTRLGK